MFLAREFEDFRLPGFRLPDLTPESVLNRIADTIEKGLFTAEARRR